MLEIESVRTIYIPLFEYATIEICGIGFERDRRPGDMIFQIDDWPMVSVVIVNDSLIVCAVYPSAIPARKMLIMGIFFSVNAFALHSMQ